MEEKNDTKPSVPPKREALMCKSVNVQPTKTGGAIIILDGGAPRELDKETARAVAEGLLRCGAGTAGK